MVNLLGDRLVRRECRQRGRAAGRHGASWRRGTGDRRPAPLRADDIHAGRDDRPEGQHRLVPPGTRTVQGQLVTYLIRTENGD